MIVRVLSRDIPEHSPASEQVCDASHLENGN